MNLYCKRGHERTAGNLYKSSGCKICVKESAKKWATAERARKRAQNLCLHNGCNDTPIVLGGRCEVHRRYQRVDAHKTKLEVLAAYGGKCACCGETEEKFLSIDHVFNDGHVERKLGITGGHNMYCSLKKRKFPKGYQVLCFNCNLGRSVNKGICPHLSGKRTS